MLTRRAALFAPLLAMPARAAERTVRIGQATPAISFLPVMAARALNLFPASGLGLEWAAIPGGDPATLAALDSGDIDLAAVGSETLLAAIAKQQPFQFVHSLMSKVSLDLVLSTAALARAGVGPDDPLDKRLAALRGLVIGVSAIGGTQDRMARWLAGRAGLDPRTGVQVAMAGPPPAIQAALDGGRVDAFVLSPPEGLIAEANGTGRRLIRIGDAFPELRGVPSLVLAARTPLADRALLVDALRVLRRAAAQVVADPPGTASRMQAALFPRIAAPLIAQSVASLADGVADGGRLTAAGMTALLRYAPDVAPGLDPADDGGFWTSALTDAAS